ncbi:hypothetical protein AXF42_Ash015841 [Apostasia shenzhenica]|uniref:Uncharacterized protein n=1 Tax=Apostasia shenzhenica TaxID=1088818 RepID=A0A2H9ZXP5_9ASPA|nr:hypothetical protein AXF42_Ash015841 [Apostasia shenzhenica]
MLSMICPISFAFVAKDLTYTWSDQWRLRFDNSMEFTGGSFFLVGKLTTVDGARLVPGNTYELNFVVENGSGGDVEVELVVETTDAAYWRRAKVAGEAGLSCLPTPEFVAGEADDALRFFMRSTDASPKKGGLFVYAVIYRASKAV